MINKILKTGLTVSVASLMWASLATVAHAGDTQDKIHACRTAMNMNMGFDTGRSGEVYYKFKSIHGTVVQRLKFRAQTNDGTKTVTCKVKRKKVLELMDGKKRPLQTFKPAEVDDPRSPSKQTL